ncbi:MAG: sulfatase-like hydrolase/transferase [Kiritimatiellales bacterium]|nr:sulfatase-like hydrolase/transferase [Kiritimatiellales bacterium]
MKVQIITAILLTAGIASAVTYPIVDTGQTTAYGGHAGQDAHYSANTPSYMDNGDGTITDQISGLMWTKDPGEKMTYAEAVRNASKCRTGDYKDWRLPTIKELYSLIQLDGTDPDPTSEDTTGLTPFIDDTMFKFQYGDTSRGERIIDSQFATSTKYVSTTMGGNETMFGVNFADGRIKGYPIQSRRGEKTFFVLYVRGNPDYGKNKFKDNGDGTIADKATGLTWMKADNGKGMDWPTALEYAEGMEFAGHSDWRLPNAKELQSIIDYTRSPDTTGSAAIDPVFEATEIKNEGGKKDYAHYWSSSSHVSTRGADAATYFAFGRSLGWMGPDGNKKLMDVHGAGSQRSDPKTGDASRFPYGRGPQGDVIRIDNMVRLVRGGNVEKVDAPVVQETTRRRPGPPEGVQGSGPAGQREGGRAPRSTEDFLERFDSNKDGQVSKKEFTGPANRFPMLDQDGNGIITKAEFEAAPPSGQRGGGTDRQGQQSAGRKGGRGGSGFLERFDANKDGQVTKEEFTGPAERFPTLDKDGNGIISKDEIPTGPPAGQREGNAAPRPFKAPEAGRTSAASVIPGKISKPSFVFILIDDMGWTGLSAAMDDQVKESKSDYYQTPNIEILASQGMRFSNAYSPGPMCTPSRAGILTGKTPAELHLTTPGGGGRVRDYQRLIPAQQVNGLPEKEDTVAELLKKEGYATAHFGKWHLGNVSPGEHGFDYHDGTTANDGPGAYKDPNPKDMFGITERAIDFLSGQVQAGKPFYLQLSHYAVHMPNEALQKTIEKFNKLPTGKRHINPEYAAMTYDLDTAIGILLKKIEELGIADSTYVVLMSDNGAPGNPRRPENVPLAGGKGSLYEGGIRVPLIVCGPDIKPNTFCRESVTGCDLFPTFCEWAGVPAYAKATADKPGIGKIEGTSLVPLLTGEGKFQRLENTLLFHYPHYGQGPAQKPQSAIIVGNYKLLRDLETGTAQLFDLDKDISEANDLSKRMPEKAQEMEKLMDARLKAVGAQLPTKNPDYDPSADSGTRQRRRRM